LAAHTASTNNDSTWPRTLSSVTGPYPTAKVEGAALGMGEVGPANVALHRSGILPPDLMTGLTLYLIARQPRREAPPDSREPHAENGKRGAPGVSGSIWVRERAIYHRPIPSTDAFHVDGAQIGRHIRKGRRYASTWSKTVDSAGRLAGTNRTTGLVSYRVDNSLKDRVEGQGPDETPDLGADWTHAQDNPHLRELSDARVGQVLGGDSFVVSLAMMAARDTDNPDNPIHSDPASARAAGLKKPIAGGSHVQAFALELLMARFGPQVLLHGAYVDCRWKRPTEAEDAITPRAEVIEVRADRVAFSLEVRHETGPIAMVGSVVIPRPT